jgi:endoribonuclease LACTB2
MVHSQLEEECREDVAEARSAAAFASAAPSTTVTARLTTLRNERAARRSVLPARHDNRQVNSHTVQPAHPMSKPAHVTIVNVGYRSTNYWVVSAGASRFLIDLGYPGTMGAMRASLKRMSVPLEEIQYGLATHYHIDHAGLAQELKLAGVKLLVLETQVAAIPLMKQWTKPQDQYVGITKDGNVIISFAQSRSRLEQIGIAGEILPTPGHSADSVSLLLDDGSAFTGDLTPLPYAGQDDRGIVVATSWRLLRERGAARIYPGHGPVLTCPPFPPHGC